MKVGLISALLNGLTNGPRVIIFDLLFDKKKDLLKSTNISAAIISVAVNIMTTSVSTDFFNRSN